MKYIIKLEVFDKFNTGGFNSSKSLISQEVSEAVYRRIDKILIEEQRWERKKRELENDKKIFMENHPELLREWEKYKPTKIKDGVDSSLSFFMWLGHIKKINFRNINIQNGEGNINSQ